MAKQVYWLCDAEWRRIEPLLPRGRKGAHRVDDRRVISGIVYMLRCGARWRDCPEVYGPYTTIYKLEPSGNLDRDILCTNRIHRDVRVGFRRFDLHQSPPLGCRRKRGPSTTPSVAHAAVKRPKSTR